MSLEISALLGTWLNTNAASRGIVRLEIAAKEEDLGIRSYGSAVGEPIDWGEAHGDVFALEPGSSHGLAFRASYDFGFADVNLQSNIKQGVLVVAIFTRFKDDSGRSNYFAREFYYRQRTTP